MEGHVPSICLWRFCVIAFRRIAVNSQRNVVCFLISSAFKRMMLKKLARMIGAGAQPAAQPQVPADTRIYAIGDIHGRADLLEQLLELIERDAAMLPAPATVTCIFLGDYVDRGPHSAQVVERLIQMSAHSTDIICLLGNHEDVLRDVLAGKADSKTLDSWLGYGGRETLASYGVNSRLLYADDFDQIAAAARAAVPPSHAAFLQQLQLSVTLGDYFFVHAGIHPARSISDQRPQDMIWIREPFLSYDRPLEKMIVHGHSISRTVEERVHRVGIDTGAYATGRLTAIVLEGSSRRFLETSYTPG
jgi:serine/threonine protein phosphatase 1